MDVLTAGRHDGPCPRFGNSTCDPASAIWNSLAVGSPRGAGTKPSAHRITARTPLRIFPILNRLMSRVPVKGRLPTRSRLSSFATVLEAESSFCFAASQSGEALCRRPRPPAPPLSPSFLSSSWGRCSNTAAPIPNQRNPRGRSKRCGAAGDQEKHRVFPRTHVWMSSKDRGRADGFRTTRVVVMLGSVPNVSSSLQNL